MSSHSTTPDTSSHTEHDWRQIHETLLDLAQQASQIDWQIGRQLLQARQAGCHRQLGFASVIEYADHILGYSPHTTMERLRVAEALETLPRTAEALRSGEAKFSAIRELTRVSTPATEARWLAAAQQKTVREVEELVRGHRPGDSPDDAVDPNAARHVLRFDVSPETYASFREAVGLLQRESESRFGDDELLLLIARKLLRGPGDEGRASYQIAVTTCEQCQRAWQEGHGELVPIDDSTREMAECDAQHIGSINPTAPVTPSGAKARATQTIPPGTRRLVRRRHHGCCGVSGCRHASFVDVHHTNLRSEGGDHDPEHLIVLCSAHHVAVHAGRLLISGTASRGFRFRHADGSRYGGHPDPVAADENARAFFALTHMGYKEKEARGALDAVRSHVGRTGEGKSTLESLVRLALEQLAQGHVRAA